MADDLQPGEVLAALLTPQGRANPYPLYAALHEAAGVIRADGLVLVPGYEAASAVLRDPASLVADAMRYDTVMPGWRDHPAMTGESLLNLNPPQHARTRELLSAGLSLRQVASLEPAVAALADSLLDGLADRGARGRAVDFMPDFAVPLPVSVICELIGVPEEHRTEFRPLARALADTLEPACTPERWAAADAAASDLAGYFTALAAERRPAPAGDLISALVSVGDTDDGRLSDSELADNLVLLLVAGVQTTANLLGNGLRIILADPLFGADISAGTLPVAGFAEEVLRYDSPVQLVSRRRAEAAELAGVAVTPEDEILVLLGAANRDPRRFNEPNRFNPARPDSGTLSFGAGPHFCLGAELARLEAAVAFPRLLRRFPRIAAAGDPVRRDGLVLRGYESLPVVLE